MRKLLLAAVLAAAPGAGLAATADPTGDFLATFTGTPSPQLDFTSAQATFDGAVFDLQFTLAGAPTGSPNILHVWGIDRGAGTARLNALFDPDIDPGLLWDSLAVLTSDGTLRIVTFPAMGAPSINLIAGGAVVTGNSIRALVPLAVLPTRGFSPTQYQFQLWSRLRADPAVDGPNFEIADLGPRLFAAVPEPQSWALLIAGFGLAGWRLRARPHVRFTPAHA